MSILVLGNQYPYKHPISVELPFERVTARAVIIRRSDGAVLGTCHHEGARYALPGGGLNDGEEPSSALIRELTEESITLYGIDAQWQGRIAVDYYSEYQELAIWYVVTVEGATIGISENIETRWIYRHEDVWYPEIREKIVLHVRRYLPSMVSLFRGSVDVG